VARCGLITRGVCGACLQGRFGLEGSRGDLWLVEEGGGEGERGTGAWLACPVRLAAAGF
jgi:hypothetical protein